MQHRREQKQAEEGQMVGRHSIGCEFVFPGRGGNLLGA
jgi:hypothetical protein